MGDIYPNGALVWECHCSVGDPWWTLCQPWPFQGCHGVTHHSQTLSIGDSPYKQTLQNKNWTEPTVNGRIAWNGWNDCSNDDVSQQLLPWSGPGADCYFLDHVTRERERDVFFLSHWRLWGWQGNGKKRRVQVYIWYGKITYLGHFE